MTIGSDGGWSAHDVAQNETHPSEDVALLNIPALPHLSFLRPSPKPQHSSFEYMQWAYPDDVVQELEEHGQIVNRPDLFYLQGYIRRRLSDVPLLGIKGRYFYELNEPGAIGCSGSPIIARRGGATWEVVGIFVGERRSKTMSGYTAVGYAVRMDALTDWIPSIAGKTIFEL
nr:hypothetical protein [Nocardia sp. AG03]